MIVSESPTVVDTTQFPDGTTIYVDGTNFNFAQTGWEIKKLENQTIVFNIPGDSVLISKEYVTVYDKDGNKLVDKLDSNTGGNGGDADHNENVEKYILDHIVSSHSASRAGSLQTSTHAAALEYFSSSSRVNSIALLELPQAGKTVSNRFSDSSQYISTSSREIPNAHTPPIA